MSVVDSETNECFFLKWKTQKKDQRKGRELDPRYYNVEEELEFRAADAKEWKSFLDTGAVVVVPPSSCQKGRSSTDLSTCCQIRAH